MKYTRKGSFIGQRIEIAPHLDLWMRGARFGVIVMQSTAHKPGELMLLKVRMDNERVKRLAVIHVADIGRVIDAAPAPDNRHRVGMVTTAAPMTEADRAAYIAFVKGGGSAD